MSGTDGTHQKLAAILAADAAGYSRLMAADEPGTLAALDAARAIFRAQIESHHGRVVDMAGDSVLALFETATGAVGAALAAQAEIEMGLAGVPADRRLRFRVGVHLGDVIEKADGSVYGDGVNIAARLEGLSQPGGITVSDAVHGAVRNRIAASFEDLGEQQVKNIVDPVRVFRVVEAGAGSAGAAPGSRRAVALAQRLARWRWWAAGAAAVAVVAMLGVRMVGLGGGGPGADGPPLMSVAVLPVKAASAADEPFAEVFTRDLTAALAQGRPGVPVASYNTVMARQGQLTDARAWGKDLNVRYLVEGQVGRDGAQVVASLALIDALNAKQIWTGRIETPAAKVGEWSELPLLRAAQAVRIAQTEAERRRLASQPESDASLSELVFRSFSFDTQTREGVEKALALCEKALRLDAASAEALTCKAGVILAETDLVPGPSNARRLQQADELSRRAIELSSGDAGAWSVRADALQKQHQPEAALEANSRAVQLQPSRAGLLSQRALLLLLDGRPEEALSVVARATDIDPTNVGFNQRIACRAYMALGRYEQAIASCERSASEAEFWSIHVSLAVAYAQTGQAAKAAAAKAIALERKPEFTIEGYRALLLDYTDSKLYWEQFDQFFLPGLRKAGFRER